MAGATGRVGSGAEHGGQALGLHDRDCQRRMADDSER